MNTGACAAAGLLFFAAPSQLMAPASAGPDAARRSLQGRPDLDRKWLKLDGALAWRSNDGFAFQPGSHTDRYGCNTGTSLAPMLSLVVEAIVSGITAAQASP